MNKKICKKCNNEILKNQPIFYFPNMPKWHELSDLSKQDFHINCIKDIDSERNVGEILANIMEDISKKTKIRPFLGRSGNIVVQAILDEKSIEIFDFEDFVDFDIPIINLEKIVQLKPTETIANRMTSLHVLEDQN